MVKRFEGSGRSREGGAPATHKQDFNAHVTGGDWRHEANHIDVSPSVLGQSEVQAALEALETASDNANFISVGDGFENCTGDLANAFTTAFAEASLANGGIVLVKAGDYCMNTTVTVPQGISIIGERGGATIVGEMSETPMFIFQTGNVVEDVQPSVLEMIQSADFNVLANLKLYDNVNGNVAAGAPSMSGVPMLQMQHGANLVIEKCYLIGRAVTGPVSVTNRAIGFSGITTPGVGTVLHVRECYIDGVQTAIDFDARQGNLDYLKVESNRVRTFGDGGLGTQLDRYFITLVNCNAVITNNEHNGLNTTFGAEGCILFKDIGITNTPTSMNIQGNTGGLDAVGSGDFLTDLRSVQDYIRIINVNNWGTHHTDSFILQNVDDELTVGGSLKVTGGTLGFTVASKDQNDVVSNNLTWDVKTEGGVLNFETSGSNNENYLDVEIVGIEDGEEVVVIWNTDDELFPPYFYISGLPNPEEHEVKVGPVRFPQPGKTVFTITRIGDQIYVRGDQADSGYRTTVNTDSGIGYKKGLGELYGGIASAGNWRFLPSTGGSLSIYPYTGGSYLYGHWVHYRQGALEISADLAYWDSVNTSSWLGTGPVKLTMWQRGANQGVILSSGGSVAGPVMAHEIVDSDLAVSGSYNSYDITGVEPDITFGTDDWFVLPDRANARDFVYMIGRSTGKCYVYSGTGVVTELGTTGAGSTTTLDGHKIAASNDGQILVYTHDSTTFKVSTDGGATWGNISGPGGTWKWVTYSPVRGLFCVVGNPNGTDYSSATSRDGINWHFNFGGLEYHRYIFSKVTSIGGYFYAIGFGSQTSGISAPTSIYMSIDGETWLPIPGTALTHSTAGFFLGDRVAAPTTTSNIYVSGQIGHTDSTYEFIW